MDTDAELTIDAYLDEWLQLIRTRVRRSTCASHQRMADAYIRPHIGSLRVAELTARHLDRLDVELLTGGARRGGHLAQRTVAHTHAVLPPGVGTVLPSGSRCTRSTGVEVLQAASRRPPHLAPKPARTVRRSGHHVCSGVPPMHHAPRRSDVRPGRLALRVVIGHSIRREDRVDKAGIGHEPAGAGYTRQAGVDHASVTVTRCADLCLTR